MEFEFDDGPILIQIRADENVNIPTDPDFDIRNRGPERSVGCPNTNAYALSVDEIVTKANHASYYQGKDGKAKV